MPFEICKRLETGKSDVLFIHSTNIQWTYLLMKNNAFKNMRKVG